MDKDSPRIAIVMIVSDYLKFHAFWVRKSLLENMIHAFVFVSLVAWNDYSTNDLTYRRPIMSRLYLHFNGAKIHLSIVRATVRVLESDQVLASELERQSCLKDEPCQLISLLPRVNLRISSATLPYRLHFSSSITRTPYWLRYHRVWSS